MTDFSYMYHSPCVFINGISLGFPFTNKDIFFYLKAMYFQKSGTPIIYHFELIDDKYVTYTTRDWDDEIICKQWLGNMGVQYNLGIKTNNVLIFNGGITLFQISEKNRDSSIRYNAKGFNGFFVGIGYEERILDNLSLFSEGQYNVDIWQFKVFGYDIAFKHGGANLNVGIRYYFSQNRR
jgi:hypothetical protein